MSQPKALAAPSRWWCPLLPAPRPTSWAGYWPNAGKDDPAQLAYGQSITDACLGWDDSLECLEVLSAAVKARRG